MKRRMTMNKIPAELDIIYQENPTITQMMLVVDKYIADSKMSEMHLCDLSLLGSCYETARQYYHDKHTITKMKDTGEYLALKT